MQKIIPFALSLLVVFSAAAQDTALIPTEYANPSAVASSAVYQKMLNDKSFNLNDQQRFAVEKCYAQALFVEGNTAEAKALLAKLSDREREFNREELTKQNLSAEFTELYKKHRADADGLYGEYLSCKDDLDFGYDDFMRGRRYGSRSLPPSTAQRFVREFHVVPPSGNGGNSILRSGAWNNPCESLTQVRDAVRQWRASDDVDVPKITHIRVVIHGGVYPVTETFVLEAQDSGTADLIITYDPDTGDMSRGRKPIFTGGVSVADFKKVDNPNILKRLPLESRDKVFVATIPGDVKFPPAAPRGFGANGLGAAPAVELFVNDKPLQIARYPNAPKPGAANALRESERSFVKTGKVHRGIFNTDTANQPGIFEYTDSRHERWTEAKDAMLFGYWGYLWAITSCRVEKIDPDAKQVVLATNNPYGYRADMPYYAFNLLEEIDEPGEWYLDRENNRLYVYPPNGVDINAAKVQLSCFPKEFITAKDVSHVTISGLHFEEGTGDAIRVEGGENFNIIGCSIKRFGNWGLGLSGKNHRVLSCDFVSLGGGGIELNGGDVRTLTPGNCLVENTFVHDFSRVDRCYAPAVGIGGVGNRLAHNLFCDSPGHAIRVGGMEQVIECNEVHSIVYESDDQSGIDIFGNPYIRGMVFRYNYWHHIGSGRECGSAGIRLDDMISSVLMYGNVFFRASGGHFGGIQIHGGKNNIADGNLMIDCKYAVSCSPWGEKRWLEQLETGFGPPARQEGFDPDSEVFKTKYSDFAELKVNVDRNIITRNAAIGCDVFAYNGSRNIMLNNVMLPWMPSLFTETRGMKTGGEGRVPSDARGIRGRLSIPLDSPIYDLLGIAPIPVDSMGLYKNNLRKELPKTEITPFFVLE